jgi:hypothetical protein
MRFLNCFKPKLFVLISGKYKRVTGPSEVLNSLKGLGGYVVIGDEIVISSGIYFSGGNSVGSNNINGYLISRMSLRDVTPEEMKILLR